MILNILLINILYYFNSPYVIILVRIRPVGKCAVPWAWCRALQIVWHCLIPLPLFSLNYNDFKNLILAWMLYSASWAAPLSDFHGLHWSVSGFGAEGGVWSWLTKQICEASSWQYTSSDLKRDTASDICFKGITALSLFELNTGLCLYFFD